MTGNNVRRLRVAFLLTPRQLAARMGAETSDVERIEAEGFELSEEWIIAVARALGVPESAVTSPKLDVEELRLCATDVPMPTALCPTAARHALLALVAKFGGPKMARALDEDDIARAVQNFRRFVETGEGDVASLSRLKQALQITVLACLQSRDFAPGPNFQADLEEALSGAAEMVRRFSRIGPGPAEG